MGAATTCLAEWTCKADLGLPGPWAAFDFARARKAPPHQTASGTCGANRLMEVRPPR